MTDSDEIHKVMRLYPDSESVLATNDDRKVALWFRGEADRLARALQTRPKASVNHLHVHKNTIEKRRKRDMAREVSQQVETIIRETDVRAYAFVAIDANGGAHCRFDTGAILPLWGFPSTISAVIHREIQTEQVSDDWKPSLPIEGGK